MSNNKPILAIRNVVWREQPIGDLYTWTNTKQLPSPDECLKELDKLPKPCCFYTSHLPLTELLHPPYLAGLVPQGEGKWSLYTTHPYILARPAAPKK
jgi:hypothetical protein